MKKWYKVNCIMAHQGSGKYRDTTNYVFAHDISEVLQRYSRMPGVKRSRIPSIEEIKEEELSSLEEEITANHVSLQLAKRTWYFGTRRLR